MNLETLITTLESSILTRRTVTTNKGHIISYWNDTGNTHSVTINGDTINNLVQLCLTTKDNTTYLYVNHSTRRNLTKISVSTISTLSIT